MKYNKNTWSSIIQWLSSYLCFFDKLPSSNLYCLSCQLFQWVGECAIRWGKNPYDLLAEVPFILEPLRDYLSKNYKLRVKQSFNNPGLPGYDPCLYSLSLECLLVLLSRSCCCYNHNCCCPKKWKYYQKEKKIVPVCWSATFSFIGSWRRTVTWRIWEGGQKASSKTTVPSLWF